MGSYWKRFWDEEKERKAFHNINISTDEIREVEENICNWRRKIFTKNEAIESERA